VLQHKSIFSPHSMTIVLHHIIFCNDTFAPKVALYTSEEFNDRNVCITTEKYGSRQRNFYNYAKYACVFHSITIGLHLTVYTHFNNDAAMVTDSS